MDTRKEEEPAVAQGQPVQVGDGAERGEHAKGQVAPTDTRAASEGC